MTIDCFVDGAKARNRAFDGDTVVVAIEPRDSWRTTGEMAANADDEALAAAAGEQLRVSDASDNGVYTREQLQSAYNGNGERLQALARVVRVEMRERAIGDTVVGWLRSRSNDFDVSADDTYFMLVPTDAKLPTMLVLASSAPAAFVRNAKSFESKLVACRMRPWSAAARQPLATVVEVLGDSFNVAAATRALLMQYQVLDRPHSAAALECLPDDADNWSISDAELARRRDFRPLRVFTVDPATARDLDDALHVRTLPNGNVECGVHIADVTAFLPAGCALDIEAQRRNVTVYLNERSIPVLPRILCDKLCSLHPNVDRLTFSVVWELDEEG